MNDQRWFERILSSLHDRNLGLPGFPSTYLQEVFVGRSNEKALEEAFTFYKIVKNSSFPLTRNSRVLDFGVGWGRIIRFFTREVDPSGLYGVDVDGDILNEAKSIGVEGQLGLIGKSDRLEFPDNHFDVVYAFSVFSHISKDSASHWLGELMRVLKPGGTLVLTTTTDRFLNLCLACSLKTEGRNSYEENYARMFAEPVLARERYRQGEHVYAAASGNAAVLDADSYGWAAMPPAFVKREIGHVARSIRFFDEPEVLEQGFFIVRKKQALPARILRKLRDAISG
ncbi:class I SAM-dependent methyltransferase [Rhodanobacter sp. MP7CTX1]|uniref:class I SAM-dependent methyltransferase n=1 Tax=Rhodanobacter sp. MP7CTX1 TaxID=2723084 RepID=UPI0017ABFC63|nr:class I SAM-dependent methyltransferase [Rhodanobacter sp. MP7CTX1]MBB6187492.1 ubiquinone/menaquinone biosynthesis C-methylase UbiE [Rhodanobacter sp. MP7CTX1]